MNRWTLGGAGLIVAWIVLAFVIAWPSGWAHVPLALGVTAFARGILESGERGDRGTANGER